MFVKCMKRYFINLKYVFAVLGILFLSLLIACTVFTGGTRSVLKDMTAQIKDVSGDKDLTSEELASGIGQSLIQDFQDTEESNRSAIDKDGDKLVSGEELQSSVVDAFSSTVAAKVENFVDCVAKIGEIISSAILKILLLLMVFVGIQFLGGMLAKGFILLIERYNIEHRNPFHLILARFIHVIFAVAMATIVLWLYSMEPTVGLIVLVFVPLLYCIISLLAAAIAQGKKHRAPLRKIMSITNILSLFSSNILILVIFMIIGVGVLYISNFVIAFYLEFALWVVTSATVSLNADLICYEVSRHKHTDETYVEDDITFTEIE